MLMMVLKTDYGRQTPAALKPCWVLFTSRVVTRQVTCLRILVQKQAEAL
jgi:hypothetical protein